MKKVFVCAVVLFLALSVTAFADRNAIEEIILVYESVVIEAEEISLLAYNHQNDFIRAERAYYDAVATREIIRAFIVERGWLIDDLWVLADLNYRFNVAMTTIAKKIMNY